MTHLLVGADHTLRFHNQSVRCALGRAGIVSAEDKREGDGATPAGTWPLRRVFYRPDIFDQPPESGLAVSALRPNDGWCDAPGDANYNTQVSLPYGASCESLWRDDHVYGIIVIMGYNDDPVVEGKGSAIFFHLARPDYSPTEGCVAVALADMLAVLAVCGPESAMTISL